MSGATLGTAYVQIVPTAKGIQGSVSNLLAPEAKAAGTATGTTINKFAAKALLAGAVGAAFIKVVKGALDEGGKLQQSYFGGLDTIYGEAAEGARTYAREAAKAGISMNEYSEQAVSFGAALRQAFAGDTVKAAEAANTAILDMADNSAKMGTSMESIQNAYQGFAKQNYTMLDNLKLGYGGTKKEMERLLADATALTGVEYNIENLGDVYAAIHAIQGELGIAGVAAAEAEGTFTGSFNSMRAAAKNFLGSLAIGEDVSESLRIMAVSASTFVFKNFIPMLGTVLKALPGAILSFLGQGVPLLMSGISQLVSNMVNSLGAVVQNLSSEQITKWATTMLPKMLSSAGSLIGHFVSGLIINIPKIVAALGRIGFTIVTGLGSALWGKVQAAAAGIRDRFMKPINEIRDKFKAVVDKIKGFFPISIGRIMSNIKLPHFKISGKFGLNPPQTPKFSIDWYAKGGIFNTPTIAGLGDVRGGEAAVPLDPFWDKMDKIAESMQGGNTFNFYISGDSKNATEIAEEVEKIIVKKVNQRRLAWQ